MATLGGEYVQLISCFLTLQVDASEFEHDYLKLFKAEKRVFPERVFEIFNDLFIDVDAFCLDPELRDDDDLNEEQLRASAANAMRRYQQL